MGWASDAFWNDLGRSGRHCDDSYSCNIDFSENAPKEIKQENNKEESMNLEYDVFGYVPSEEYQNNIKKEEIKIALCHFSGGTKLYAFKTTEMDLKLGDKVIVNANDDFNIATFIDYARTSEMQSKATKWIVQKIDIEEFKEKVKKLEKTSF